MSRIGKRPIALPKGVTVGVKDGSVEVKGPKGSLSRPFASILTLEIKDGQASVGIKPDVQADTARTTWGSARAHLANAILGVSEGFKANLKLEGTGYRAELKGQTLNLSLGLSHPVAYDLPKAITAKIPAESKGTVIQLETFDKDALGQTVAKLQSFRPPEPYKGKGIRYTGERIRQKAGKTGGKGKK